MAPTTPANHDPALAHNPAAAPQQPSQPPGGLTQGFSGGEIPNLPIGIDGAQLISILRSIPNVFNKLTEQGNLKEDAAQTLSNLSHAPYQHQLPVQQHPYPGPPPAAGLPGINDPGPSSHPRGPPNLGQLSSVALSAAPAAAGAPGGARAQPHPGQLPGQGGPQEMGEGSEEQQRAAAVAAAQAASGSGAGKEGAGGSPSASTGATTRRGGRSATMGSDEWSRQRKDNHKEVERRRRGNINEGINELGRIVPNGSGEKAKGAILARAVQYIHHLKENEARNIEKWTLEKLLMDQAMGDLQTQLEELKRLWEEERMARQRAESELEVLKGVHAAAAAAVAANPGPSGSAAAATTASGAAPQLSASSAAQGHQQASPTSANAPQASPIQAAAAAGGKVENEGPLKRPADGTPSEVAAASAAGESDRDGKRQRTE